jgi:hypothetical protein
MWQHVIGRSVFRPTSTTDKISTRTNDEPLSQIGTRIEKRQTHKKHNQASMKCGSRHRRRHGGRKRCPPEKNVLRGERKTENQLATFGEVSFYY